MRFIVEAKLGAIPNAEYTEENVPEVWVLETTNIARKFSGAVDWFASYVECSMDSRRVFVPSPSPLG